jgi:ribonucleoside-diphosphate reductase beta chain
MQAVNWNVPKDINNRLYDQNIMQFWTPEEFNVGKDLRSWDKLSTQEKDTYVKVLAGLTGLDTMQGGLGMPLLTLHTDDKRSQGVLQFMAGMEGIHAKSYSNIFTTLLSQHQTSVLLEEWVPGQEQLTFKEQQIRSCYAPLLSPAIRYTDLYMAHVASVLLESFLFYSGFFYPLHLASQGEMIASGEIISKIIMDESIHGAFVGHKAKELRKNLAEADRDYVDAETVILWNDLLRNEDAYTEELYAPIGLVDEVKNFVRWNLNRALQTLGLEEQVAHEPVSASVLNGLTTGNKTHDFFSVKGDSYVLSSKVEEMNDDDFDF